MERRLDELMCDWLLAASALWKGKQGMGSAAHKKSKMSKKIFYSVSAYR